MWIDGRALVKYLASTYVPWILLVAVVVTAGFSTRELALERDAARAELAAIRKTPKPASSSSSDPWIIVGNGSAFADIPNDRLKLLHETAILASENVSCLMRSTVLLIEVDEAGRLLKQGSVDVTVEKVDNCTHLVEAYGPECPDPKLPNCSRQNGHTPL
jgi:hypothetical protein